MGSLVVLHMPVSEAIGACVTVHHDRMKPIRDGSLTASAAHIVLTTPACAVGPRQCPYLQLTLSVERPWILMRMGRSSLPRLGVNRLVKMVSKPLVLVCRTGLI